jgi:lipopolysaccharide transport system permease protein
MLGHLLEHRRYIWKSAWTDFRIQYASTQFGVFWHVVHPLTSVLIYVIVFTFVVGDARWFDSSTTYVLVLCAGVLTWVSFSESLLQGSNALLANSVYLRRLPLPGEVFIAKSLLASSISTAIMLGFLVVLSVALGVRPTLSWAFVPLIGVLFQALAFGAALLLAPLRVLFRDVGEALRSLLLLWLWTQPIVYPVTLVPEEFRPWLLLNPPYAFIDSLRGALLHGVVPDAGRWLLMLGWVGAGLVIGRLVLDRCRSATKDNL